MTYSATIIDGHGIKSSLLWDEETTAWTYHSNEPERLGSALYRTIPTLYRGIEKNADALTKIPFAIFKGKREIDSSQDWQNKLEYLPNPRRLFALISRSLDKRGVAYLLRVRNKAGYTKELRWLAPSSIEPDFSLDGELLGFQRRPPGQANPINYKPEEVIHFWLPDDDIEQGPPTSYPLRAAAQASGVLHNLDAFISLYFERGAVRPLVVTTKGMPDKNERERMETWLQQLWAGLRNAFKLKIFNADTVAFQTVGDGLDQLQDQTLTADQRFDVALALGIPQTILFANAANYATSLNDYRSWYDATITPRAEFIASELNEQLLKAENYRLEFSPESLDIYQEDERERAQAVSTYVTAGMPLLMALDVLGVELTEEQRAELEQAEDEHEPAPALPPESVSVETGEQPDGDEAQAEMKRWRRAALEAWRKGKALPVDWIAEALPGERAEAVRQALKAAVSTEQVWAAFETKAPALDLAAELKRANDLLEAVKKGNGEAGFDSDEQRRAFFGVVVNGGGGGGGSSAPAAPQKTPTEKAKEAYGGKPWAAGDKQRFYLDRNSVRDELGVDIKFRGSGSIDRASIDGNSLSANEGYALAKATEGVFIDEKAGQLIAPNFTSRYRAATNAYQTGISRIASKIGLGAVYKSVSFKYSPDQPRDDDGRWSGGGDSISGGSGRVISSQRYLDYDKVDHKIGELSGKEKVTLPVVRAGEYEGQDLFILVDGHHTAAAARELNIPIEYQAQDPSIWNFDEQWSLEDALESNWMDSEWYYFEDGGLVF